MGRAFCARRSKLYLDLGLISCVRSNKLLTRNGRRSRVQTIKYAFLLTSFNALDIYFANVILLHRISTIAKPRGYLSAIHAKSSFKCSYLKTYNAPSLVLLYDRILLPIHGSCLFNRPREVTLKHELLSPRLQLGPVSHAS